MTNELRTPSDIVKHLAAERALRHPGCGGGGYFRSFDTDYDCGGCAACSWTARLGYVIADAAQLTAGAELRARCESALAAYTALRAIGLAVASALAPGAAVHTFVNGATAAWNTVRKGRWYRVAGKRGNAKKVHEAIGQCMGVYAEERRSAYGTYSYGTTTKAALKIEGHEKLVYVTVANLEPIAEPDHARIVRVERESAKLSKMTERPAFPAHLAGAKGATGRIVEGKYAGKAGKVFWYGQKQDGPRVGVKLCACAKRCVCEVAWCSAHDVIVAEAR